MSKGKILRRRRVKVQSALSELRVRWAQLPTMERVERLRDLIDKGFSRRAIGRGLECSEGLIRQLLKLENLTSDEKQAVREGSLSVKKSLSNIHARKNGGSQRLPELEEPRKATHAELPRPAAESAAPTAKPDGQQSADRTEVVRKAFIDWVSSLNLIGPYLESLFRELDGGPWGINLVLFARLKPRPEEVSLGGEPQKVIDACRPKREIPSGPGYISYGVEWYGRWSQRVMPDPKVRRDILYSVAAYFQKKKWLVQPQSF